MTGWLSLRMARNRTPEAAPVLGTLARFAEFCGTAAQTTHGFGATTVTAEPGTPDG
jgi:CRISPR/Cas system endoribonuclease Cas6 (RAMP superfamily)